jgi:hypothetical protein
MGLRILLFAQASLFIQQLDKRHSKQCACFLFTSLQDFSVSSYFLIPSHFVAADTQQSGLSCYLYINRKILLTLLVLEQMEQL